MSVLPSRADGPDEGIGDRRQFEMQAREIRQPLNGG